MALMDDIPRTLRGKLALEAARAGGQALRTSSSSWVQKKEGYGNVVTEADRASEQAIVALIASSFPRDEVLTEESPPRHGDLHRAPCLWVIDPLDGTNNFRCGRLYYGVSVAYVENGEPVAGAVYDPVRDEVYFAEKDRGAFLNGVSIHVGQQQALAGAAVATDNGYELAATRRNMELFLRLERCPWLLVRGSAVLGMCEVACGRTDLYFHTALQPWDNAAAFLIVREAGGVACLFDGTPAHFSTSSVITGNAAIVHECARAFLSV